MSEENEKTRGVVEVFGRNILRGPLLSSDDATTIVIRKRDGKPMALFARLVDDTWAFGNEGDSDWENVKARFGVS
jgi:hypothetical protein